MACAGVGYLRCLRRQDHEKANRRLMLSVNCRFGAVIEYGRVLAGGMTGLASQAADTMALESATAADRPGAMTVTALTGLPGEVHMPRQVSVNRARGEPSPIALGRQVVLPSAIHPRESRQYRRSRSRCFSSSPAVLAAWAPWPCRSSSPSSCWPSFMCSEQEPHRVMATPRRSCGWVPRAADADQRSGYAE
jgi:hypothetical protein